MKHTNLAAGAFLAGLFIASIPAAHAQAPRISDYHTLGDYITALNASTDPQAIKIRQEIADGPANLQKERDACATRGILLTIPVSTIPATQNAHPVYAQWDDLRKKQSIMLPDYAQPLSLSSTYTPDQLAAVQKIIDDNPVVFKLIRTAAAMPANVNPGPDFSLFGTVRDAARQLRTEAYLQAYKGSFTDAVATESLGLNVARQLGVSPSIIQYLVGANIESVTLNGFQDIMDMAGPNQSVDDSVAAAINQTPRVLSIQRSLSGEIPSNIDLCEKIRVASPTGFSALSTPADAQNPAQPNAPAPQNGPAATPEERQFFGNFADAVEAAYLANQVTLFDSVELPAAQRQSAFDALDAKNSLGSVDPNIQRDPVASMIAIGSPEYSRLIQRQEYVETREQVTLAAAAILSVKAKTGAYPTALPGSFTDPYSGKPLGYTPQGQTGFVVYSVGASGAYNGVTPDDSEIAFRYPAAPIVPVAPK